MMFSVKNNGCMVFLQIMFFSLLFLCGCGKRSKEPEQMSFEELKTKAMTALEGKKSENAIRYLEQLIVQYPENQDIFEYKLILADLYLKIGQLDSAYKLYKNYTKLYPSEVKTEYAHYKSILTKFYQTLKVSRDCDEQDTHKTLKQCKAYLDNIAYKQYHDDVRDIRYTCERRLIDKEVYVFNTYLRRGKLQSAQNRIDYLKETFLSKHPSLDAQILYLESKLAQKQKNNELVKNKVETLFAKYPESQFTKMAHGLVSSKKKFTF